MLQQIQQTGQVDFGGGLNTNPNVFSLKPTQTPNCMNVKFDVGGIVEKRFGSTTLNAVVLVNSAATGFNPDSAGTLANNLVAYWKLDETAGSRLDSFGTNTLTQNNNLLATSGVVANAASFVAANTQYLSLPTNASVQVQGQNFWMTAWVNLTTKGANRTVLSKFNDQTTQYEYDLGYNNVRDQFLWVIINTAGTTLGQTSSNIVGGISTATWYMLNAWYDSANLLCTLRIDTLAATSASTTASPSNSSADFNLGADILAGPVPGALMNGLIDEVSIRKRLPTNQEIIDLWNTRGGNTYSPGASNSGWGAFDFGAAFANSQPLRWLTVAAGTGIYASSNRGVTFVVIATDRGATYQAFERSKSYLIATSDTGNKVLYWAGSVGTYMQALAPASAPPVKYALSYQGFLLLMNHSGGNRSIAYAGEPVITTDPWTTSFDLPSSFDDEITGGIILNKKAYISTKYALYRLSAVGGNPDFAYQQVKQWGWVPGTQKKVVLPQVGEVILCLSWDKKLRVFDGAEDFIISQDIERSNGMSPFALSDISDVSLNQCRAEVDTTEQVYKLLVAITPSTQTTMLLNFNTRIGAFYPYDTQSFNAMVMAESGNSRILVGVARNGFVHQLNTSNLDGTAAVNAYYQSPFLFSTTPREVRKNQKVTFYFSATSSGTVYMQDRSDFNATFSPVRGTVAFTDTTTTVLISKTVDVPLTQNVYQYQLTDSASKANPWRLLRTDHEFAVLGVGKA